MAYGSFYNFSFSSFLSSIDMSVVIWAAIFIIFVGLINYSLSRVFKNNRALPPILAILISLITVYYMAQSGVIENAIFNIGFIEIESYLPWIFLVVSILTIWRLGIGMYLIIAGVLLAGLSLLGIASKNGIALIVGIILILVGIKLHMMRRKRRGGGSGGGGGSPKGKFALQIGVYGNGTTKPKPGIYYKKSGKKIKIYAKPSNQLDYWKVNGANAGRRSSIKIRMNDNYNVLAIFRKGNSGPKPGPTPDPKPGPRPTRQRSNRELQGKYNQYSKKIQKIQKDNKGKIPSLNTKEGKLRHRYIQAMKATENIAKKKGHKLK